MCFRQERDSEIIKLRGEEDERWSQVSEEQLMKSRHPNVDEHCTRDFPKEGRKQVNMSNHAGKLGIRAGSLEC